jgi:hypothetical protein
MNGNTFVYHDRTDFVDMHNATPLRSLLPLRLCAKPKT